MSKEIIKKIKAQIRSKVWNMLEELNLADFPRPVYGRIPNFKGAEIAAFKLITLREWQRAQVVKSNPDSPQYYVRLRALAEDKTLIMATPRLRNGFLIIDPKIVPKSRTHSAATISGSFKYGKLVKLSEIPQIDVVITGCVAVDRRGARLGKGGGFSELEYGILRELGLVDEKTPILTTIHDIQVVNEEIPLEIHDLTVDYYATPSRVVRLESPALHRPRGIYWEILSESLRKLSVIKELLELKNKGS